MRTAERAATPRDPGRAVEPPSATRSRALTAAVVFWVALALGIAGRLLFARDLSHNNVYLKVFARAAETFLARGDLYTEQSGFRYPPLCAALLVPFAACGPLLGSLLWRAANFLVLLLGLRAVFRAGLPVALARGERALVLALVGITGLTGLNNGQANALILGGLLLATASALAGSAFAPAAWSTLATVCKVYPLAYGMVLATLRLRIVVWLAAGVVLTVALPFLLQSPDYVAAQYRALFELLRQEDRTGDLANAYRDLRLLTAAIGLPMPAWLFLLLQAAGGASIVLGARLLLARADARSAFTFACAATLCWFLLLGPATEKATYQFLGLPLAWSLILAVRERDRPRLWLGGIAAALTLIGLGPSPSRAVQAEQPWLRCFLPAAALLLAIDLLLQAVLRLRAAGSNDGVRHGSGASPQ